MRVLVITAKGIVFLGCLCVHDAWLYSNRLATQYLTNCLWKFYQIYNEVGFILITRYRSWNQRPCDYCGAQRLDDIAHESKSDACPAQQLTGR